MAQVTKYLVRDSNNVVEEAWSMNAPWSTPDGTGGMPDWTDRVGITHTEMDSPDGTMHRGDLVKRPSMSSNPAYRWKIEGGAWVERDDADVSSQRLAASKNRRAGEMCMLKAMIDAAQAIIDDVGSSAELVTEATTYRDKYQADYDQHVTDWEVILS